MQPELIVKSDFGGFNCFTFSEDKSLLAAGGQDDCVTIINLHNFSAFKLVPSKSFISQCLFINPQEILYKKALKKILEQRIEAKENTPTQTTEICQQKPVEGKYFLLCGSYDSNMTFWELDMKKLPLNKS